MSYLDLIKKFWKSNDEININPSAINLYLFLLECWDRNNNEDFELSDYEISKKLSMVRKTIKVCKDSLRNLGLINYQVKNGFPTFYKIIIDYNINWKNSNTTKEPVAEKKENDFSKKQTSQNITIQEPKVIEEKVSVIIEAPKKLQKESTEIVQPIENLQNIEELSNIKPQKVVKTNNKDIVIPTLEEFLTYAKTLEVYDESLDFSIKTKYETWVADGWKNGYNKPIINWQMSLKNTIPHLKGSNKKSVDIFNIPKINRLKQTYNE